MNWRRALVTLAGLLLLATLADRFFDDSRAKAPEVPVAHLPASGDDVVEVLPPGSNDPAKKGVRALKSELATRPGDTRLAVRVAEEDVRLARRFGDPRYFGEAESALRPWWNVADAPTPVLLVRATIKQSLHDFDGALVDLGRLVTKDPRSLQGWLTRAVVLTVRGDYDSAAASCDKLAGLSDELVRVACSSNVESMRGHAKAAYEALVRAASEAGMGGEASDAGALDPAKYLWVTTTLAEISARFGDLEASARHVRAALAVDSSDTYALGFLADSLLDAGRHSEVISLLRDREEVDGLLLRLAIAERATGAPALGRHVDALRARFLASAKRGDAVHRREESRFERIFGEGAQGAARAKTLAVANWGVQKESWDMRVLCEAALAAEDAKAAMPVVAFVESSHFEDPVVGALVKRVRGALP